jgi:hypothetical protein
MLELSAFGLFVGPAVIAEIQMTADGAKRRLLVCAVNEDSTFVVRRPGCTTDRSAAVDSERFAA